jgi:hypothetical protein
MEFDAGMNSMRNDDSGVPASQLAANNIKSDANMDTDMNARNAAEASFGGQPTSAQPQAPAGDDVLMDYDDFNMGGTSLPRDGQETQGYVLLK